MKMMVKQFTITALVALLMLGGCSDSKDAQSGDADALIAKTVYTLNDINGSAYEVTKSGADFRISGVPEPVVVYDIFATWCPPCRAEAPHLSSLQKKLAGKIKIIGVTIEEGNDNAYYRRFAEDIGIEYSLVNSPDNQKFSRAVAGAIGVGQDFPIPLMVVYKNGRFVKYYSGLVPEEMLESDLKALAEAQ
ncbi:TlpA disulfide reductase family protein [Sulfurimonas diazotrophicus]|uniref:TlpA disulfide reductase family protein n=1 Tax=Sulfurimonas diazotrophicus TaxID=3131939 RepID=A0ABZ3HDL3_9BACT